MLSTFFTFFWHDTSKKRKKSRFLDFQKNVKNVFSNYDPNPNLHRVFTDKGLTEVLVDVVKSLSLKIDDGDMQWR